ncbi:salt tolerance down-regulator-domain-containing protein [Pilobolus umbonatus]|nr:salt tolerance down-regulator-domain-containing protein [Pilobolus umbonatus]
MSNKQAGIVNPHIMPSTNTMKSKDKCDNAIKNNAQNNLKESIATKMDSKQRRRKNKSKDSSTQWLSSPERPDIWRNTNHTEERQRIREFWLQLTEEERRSLVKVEKETVLRKMKEQQKNTCSCSVCGKKRTAIEDELEVLYDAYYEELEQYTYRQQQNINYYNASVSEDEDEEIEDDYDNEVDSDNDIDDDDEDEEEDYRSDTTKSVYSESELGSTLAAQGSILTVADDLLKNDGRKFLDIMERLADRKIQLEQEAQADENDIMYDDENDDIEDDEEEEPRSNEQRMEDGRKMFQVFAARMFEQRVLAAYREKVAQDRQRRLIEELEEEEKQRLERELKKQRDKEKKKDKKRLAKMIQEKERLAIEERQRQEALAAELRRKKEQEQEKVKREEEKRQKEEERIRKEEEKRKKKLKEEKTKAEEREKKRKEEEERRKKIEEELQKKKEKAKEMKKSLKVVTPDPVRNEAAPIIKAKSEPQSMKSHSDTVNLSMHRSSMDSAYSKPNKFIAPIGQRRTSLAGPVGSMKSKVDRYDPLTTESQHSFFSNFLFGQPSRGNNNTSTCEIRQPPSMPNSMEDGSLPGNRLAQDHARSKWTNGWTASTVLSDNVHGKLFGDVLVSVTKYS